MKKIKFILSILFLIVLIRSIIIMVHWLLFENILFANFCFIFMLLISPMIITYGDIKLIFAIRKENKKKESAAIKIILCGLGIFFLEGIIYALITTKSAPPL